MDDLIRLLEMSQSHRDSDLATEPIDAAVRDIGRDVVAPTARPRWTRRWWVAVAAGGVVLVGVPAVAHQSGVALHTSSYGVRDRKVGDPDSEWLRMDGNDAPQLLRELELQYPLAPGYQLDPLIASWTSQTNAQSELVAWHGAVLEYSFCTWESAWLDADDASDHGRRRARQTEAATALRLRADQTVTLHYPEQTTDAYRGLATAAASGDTAALRRDLSLNCGPLR